MLGRMVGAARLDVQTYEDVEHDSGATIQAFIVVVLVSIATFVGQLFIGDDIDIGRAIVIGLVGGVARWILWALFTWLIGTTLLKTAETEADWGQLARGAGFAQTPGMLNVLLFIPILGGIIFIAAILWSFVAMIIAVRQSLDYTSTWRAFFVILIAAIPVYIITAIIITIMGGVPETESSATLINNVLQVFTV